MIDLDELQKLAEAATPGPWESVGRFIETKEWVKGQDVDIVSPEVDCMAYCYGGSARGIGNPSDAEFIAAANPQVILELIERVRVAERQCEVQAVGVENTLAERDAAVAAIERVRAIHEQHPRWPDKCGGCDGYYPCPTVEALDRAPEPAEPDWEYGFELIEPDDRNVFEREGDFISAAFAYRAAKKRIHEERHPDVPSLQYAIVRRRKAGPWLPVEGEKP